MVRTYQELIEQKFRASESEHDYDTWPMLVCSDHHFGEYSKEFDRIDYVKKSGYLDREFCAFLEHYADDRIDGKPWRLVINGDFIDFAAITFLPAEKDIADDEDFEFTEEEAQFGLDNSAQKCVWKLEHVAERHRSLFVYLADFVARGNRVEMLYGNHDVEFFWPEVQTRFVELLVEAYFGGEQVEGVTEEDFFDRVEFHQWFLYVPGRIYIEHGNQYDDFSSFDLRLQPLVPFDRSQLSMPVSHLVIRYFVNQYQGFRSHNKDNWTLLDYLRWAREQGMRNIARILFLYASLFSKVWTYARQLHETVVPQEDLDAYDELMRDNAREYGMSGETVRRIHEARHRPIEVSFARTLQVTALDKYFTAMILGSLILFIFCLGVVVDVFAGFDDVWFSNGMRLISVLAVLMLGVFAWGWSGRIMGLFAGGELEISVAPKLDRAAEAIAQFVDVRYIVMGHTHKPKKIKVRHSPEAWYVNTGAWLMPHRRPPRNTPSPLTYGVYSYKKNSMKLLRWDIWTLQPAKFSPGDGKRTSNGPLHIERDELRDALDHYEPRKGKRLLKHRPDLDR